MDSSQGTAGVAVSSNENTRRKTSQRFIFVDIQAARRRNRTQQQLLLSEIKCFPDRDSTTRELYNAVGQYIIYQAVLDEVAETTPLYLAISEVIRSTIFDRVVERAIKDHQVNLIIVNLKSDRDYSMAEMVTRLEVIIDEDTTDRPLFEELMRHGISHEQIVLGYIGETIKNE